MIFTDLRKYQGFWEQREGGIVPQEGNQMWAQHLSSTKKSTKILKSNNFQLRGLV